MIFRKAVVKTNKNSSCEDNIDDNRGSRLLVPYEQQRDLEYIG